jgi:hypothetical protein
MPQQRTPRQKLGDGLVPLLVRVRPEVKQWVREEGARNDWSDADVVRRALDEYFSRLYES